MGKVYILDGLSNHSRARDLKMRMSTRLLSFIGVMTALCVGTNYLLIGLLNVKFMDLFVFVSGYLTGSLSGALVGILTWLVYGTLNPYGFNLPTLIATCIGESIYGIAGGLCAKFGLSASFDRLTEKKFWENNLKMGIIGFILTFIYDLFTNIVTGVVFEVPLLLYIVAGIPFAVAHEVSNFFFFFLGGSILVNAIQKVALKGGEISWSKEAVGHGS
ncbi:MAG: hypothetical protein QXG97_07320, partial [Nitrososphaerota archaeon]